MTPRRTFLTSLSAVGALLLGRAAGAAPKQSGHRVVFDLTAEGAERWDAVLRNVENVRRAFAEEGIQVQVVLHGKSLPLIQKTNLEMHDRLKTLAEAGVRFSACRNTMKRFNVTPDMLFSFADTVDSATAELIRKQEAGWAYMKVGV